MNKKGQTLVLFIVFIPLFILLAAFIIDTGLIIRESTKLKSTTKTILKEIYEKEEKTNLMAEELFLENDFPVENLEVEIYDNKIRIKNSYDIESVFGKIIGLKKYEIKIDLTLKEVQNKIKIEKE